MSLQANISFSSMGSESLRRTTGPTALKLVHILSDGEIR